jgi:hypothetical protein
MEDVQKLAQGVQQKAAEEESSYARKELEEVGCFFFTLWRERSKNRLSGCHAFARQCGAVCCSRKRAARRSCEPGKSSGNCA